MGQALGATAVTPGVRAAKVAVTAAIAYQLLLVILIVLRPDLHPSWQTISEWAIGRHGWLMVAAFQMSALSYGSLFVASRPHVAGALGKSGLVLLAVCTIGTAGVGIFETDPMPFSAERGLSTTGLLHIIFGGLAMVCLPFSALCINLSVACGNPRWALSRRTLLATAAIPLLGLVAFVWHLVAVVAPMGQNAYGPGVPLGWPPRMLFLTYSAWVVAIGILIRRQGVAR